MVTRTVGLVSLSQGRPVAMKRLNVMGEEDQQGGRANSNIFCENFFYTKIYIFDEARFQNKQPRYANCQLASSFHPLQLGGGGNNLETLTGAHRT